MTAMRRDTGNGGAGAHALRRWVVPALAVALLALLTSACATRASGLGAPESPCFRSLPAASSAVEHRGRFAGVRYLTSRELAAALRSGSKAPASMIPSALQHSRDLLCVVAFQGSYGPSLVVRGWPPTVASAHLAVVVVDQHNSHVLATLLLARPPLGFSHVFPALGRTPVVR